MQKIINIILISTIVVLTFFVFKNSSSVVDEKQNQSIEYLMSNPYQSLDPYVIQSEVARNNELMKLIHNNRVLANRFELAVEHQKRIGSN